MEFIYNFVKINDKAPMIEFLDSLSIRERAKIFAYIEKLIELKNMGVQPKENLSKHLEDGIFELRVSFETSISRNLYFYEYGKQIIFTHGFVKKMQKTPKKEIKKAQLIRKLWRSEK